MLAYIARSNAAEQSIDQSMDRHIGVTMAAKPVGVVDFNPAQPKFLARREPVDIIAAAHADKRRGGGKVAGICQLVQGFVSRNQQYRDPGGLGDLRIIASFGLALPAAMRGEDGLKAESLRRLYPAQHAAIRRLAHYSGLSVGNAICQRQYRDCRLSALQRRQKPGDDGFGQGRASGIVDKHQIGRCVAQSFQRSAYGGLTSCAAFNQPYPTNPSHGRLSQTLAALRYGDDDFCYPRRAQSLCRMAQYRLAAPEGELLGHRLPGAQAFARCNNDSSNAGEGGKRDHATRRLIACRHKGNPLCAACFLGR